MPRNNSTPPDCELVDLRFVGGHIVRSVDPKKYRWESWKERGRPDLDPDAWDIRDFNVVK